MGKTFADVKPPSFSYIIAPCDIPCIFVWKVTNFNLFGFLSRAAKKQEIVYSSLNALRISFNKHFF